MNPVAKTIDTPVGIYPAPLHPGFAKQLSLCQTNEDLFKLVCGPTGSGFVNPDALNEVFARYLYSEYLVWKKAVIAQQL